ncbi:apolipoprotein N-acyltransferase [Gloeobacter kilaueensis JS1]|uniref:Apolipoprotein N-acyltransferase n=1 Tax=Gloeobacter kilaueensis (strain ATCC BAA-2537 / CCAP 1431/1 / ULC 316 / JS1) TaxID=1183438 RepID=U5QGS0_GLOK1|nr:apolipoprotein N-acyltransferase [Gloeobacter kilaueensis JS1]
MRALRHSIDNWAAEEVASVKRFVLLFLWAIALVGIVPALPATAHKPSDSYLSMNIERAHIGGQWDIALRDLDYGIGLDDNDDGAITWGELRARRRAIEAYALSRLQVRADGKACPLQPVNLLVDNHTDGTYAVLRFAGNCPRPVTAVELKYQLFFDLDPQHRGLLNLRTGGQTQTAIFSPAQASQRLTLTSHPIAQFLDFVREGVWHIWLGYDHILFLLTLLLPAVLTRKGGHWQGASSLRQIFANVLKVVTAFTLAHSLTLSLATLGVVQLPSRLVESAIAISVVFAALNNLYPLVQRRRWLIAFCFGLIHGFGFAGVLADLGLPRAALLLALVGFNLGVEAGQMAIVAAFLPVAFVLRDSWLYRRLTFAGGSALIAAIACIWFAERLFDFKVLAF